jgi:prolipoprotein diacylglyceryltransferase
MVALSFDWPGLGIGPLELRWSGLLLLLGLLGGYYAARRRAYLSGLPLGQLHDIALWTLPEAIVVARAAHVLTHLEIYLPAPARILQVWDGGYAFGAGLAMGALAAWRYTRRRSLPWGRFADAAASGLLVGGAIASFGPYSRHAAPVPALLLLGLCPLLGRRTGEPGSLFFAYVALYGLAQIAFELFRPGGAGFTLGSIDLVAWAAVIVAASLALGYHLRRSKPISTRLEASG